MKPYSVTDLHHDLAQRLAPHSITIHSVVGTPDELTIETRRVNGTEMHRIFTLQAEELFPPMAEHFADMVHLWYASHV